MSADNYRACPKCVAAAKDAEAKLWEEAQQAYGKVPQDVYLAKLGSAKGGVKIDRESLREDYELGIDESGEFTVSYSAFCSCCKFKWNFKHSERATP